MTRFLLFQSIKDSSMAGFSFIQLLFCSQMLVNLLSQFTLCGVMRSQLCIQLGFGFVVFGNFLSNMFALFYRNSFNRIRRNGSSSIFFL